MKLPGTPWRAENTGIAASVVTGDDGSVIASVALPGPEAARDVARAMAAAPDLAEALFGLMDAEGGEPGHTPGQKHAWERALSALRKYRGEAAPAATGFPQFSNADIFDLPGQTGKHSHYFTRAMVSACKPLFDSCESNHDVEGRLKRAGVINRECTGDSEYCQMFVYFRSRKAGERFIRRLNAYLARRAKKTRKAA